VWFECDQVWDLVIEVKLGSVKFHVNSFQFSSI
jgi:hypothetical protein